jgi:sugar O-acyltransferase (sialic acid O-acetyltransferase NeuD family)
MSATPLVIVCAGGLGREVAAAALADDGWNLLGFADDDPTLHGRRLEGVPVLGSPEEVVEGSPDALVVLALASPGAPRRRELSERLGLDDRRLATMVHPAAALGHSVSLGPGSVVLAGVVGTAAVSIGAHVVVMPGVVLTHDDIVEDFATLASGVTLGGGVRIGADAYVGAGAVVRERLTVGEGALVGMGAVVTRSVPAGETWFGNPARPRLNGPGGRPPP